MEDASSTEFLAGMYKEQQGKGMVQGGTDDGQLVDQALTDDDELDGLGRKAAAARRDS